MTPQIPPTPEWLAPLLRYKLWNQWELLNILCGLPPVSPDVVAPDTQKIEEARWREAANRHVTDAIRIGDLAVEPTIANQRLLDKITPHVEDPVMLGEINRAVSAARLYSDAYHIRVPVAIRWAVSQGELFPRCPLTVEHLAAAGGPVASLPPPARPLYHEGDWLDASESTPAPTTAEPPTAAPVTEATGSMVRPEKYFDSSSQEEEPRSALRRRRYARINDYQQKHGLEGREEFCRSLHISTAALQGIVRDEKKKYASATKRRVLDALGVSIAEWDRTGQDP